MKTLLISDFSKTFTDPSCPTTWSVFAKSWLLGLEYTADRNRLYDEYHDFELAGNVEKTKEWWNKHGTLFVTHGLTKELIERIVADDKYFKPRAGLSEFLAFIEEKNIPLHIVSSGISDFIEAFLRIRNLPSKQITIYGNRLTFDNAWRAVSFDPSDIVTTLNKWDGTIELRDRLKEAGKVILLGDDETDLAMYHGENLTSYGFCNDIPGYSVHLGKNASFTELISCLK